MTLVFRDDIPIHRQLAEDLTNAFNKTSSEHVVLPLPLPKNWSQNSQNILLGNKSTMLIAIGDVSLSFCMQTAPDTPGTFLMLTSKKLADKAESSGRWNGAKVWIEPQIQFKAISQLMPDIKSVGLVLTPSCKDCKEKFIAAANLYGLELKTIQTEERRQIIPALRKLFQQSDTYLMLPDPSLLNDVIFHELLRLQQEYKRPLVGPAKPFVRMGAMLSFNYNLENFVTYIAQNIHKKDLMENRDKISACCLEISINHQVADQLDISLQTEAITERVHFVTPEGEK